jgi:hypothetical protein
MKKGDKLPIINENSNNKTKICTLKEVVYSCEFFKFWSFNEINGYFEEVIKYVEKNNEVQKKAYEMNRKEWIQ